MIIGWIIVGSLVAAEVEEVNVHPLIVRSWKENHPPEVVFKCICRVTIMKK